MLALVRANRLGFCTSVLALVVLGLSVPAAAQGGRQRRTAALPVVSRPVVQPIPGRNAVALDAALSRLARDPRDIGALVDAGNAALVMGDVDAATGFFRRADQVSPGDPRAKAGLAGAMVRNGDPFDAIPLFDEAAKAGALDSALTAERALAYDLVGDNATAQRYYRQALASAPNDEITRRLALSLAIAGDKHNAELTLSPQLQQRNLAAWRTRVFALAILGQTEEAVNIANTILPSNLATGVAPYLRYMPRLTRAQQAAAANFGIFPRASEIGRDDPRVAQYAPKGTSVASADAALMPQGEPLGRKARSRDRNRSSRQANEARKAPATAMAMPSATSTSLTGTPRAAPPEPQPTRAPTGAERPASLAAAPTSSSPTSLAMATASMAKPRPAPRAPASSAPRTMGPGATASPGFNLAPGGAPASPPPAPPVSAPPAPVVQPVPARPVEAAPPLPRSLAEAFAEFERPSTDAAPAAGAVDLRRIKPSRAKPPKPPEPPPPSHPSRIWVQVEVGRDKNALGFDWRRMTRENAEAFRGKQPYVSVWGQTNRLLIGPFQSEAAANSFIAQLRHADIDGAFVWTSPAGQVVDILETGASRR